MSERTNVASAPPRVRFGTFISSTRGFGFANLLTTVTLSDNAFWTETSCFLGMVVAYVVALLLLLSCLGLQFNYWSHNPTLVTILIDVYNPAPWLHRRVDGRLRSGAPPPFVSGNVETSYGDSEDSDDESEDGCDDDSAATDSEDDRHPAPQRRPPPRAPVPAPAPAASALPVPPGFAALRAGRTVPIEMKLAGALLMIDGVAPSSVSAALRSGAELVMGRPCPVDLPQPDFWRKLRVAVIRLVRIQFASKVALSESYALGHDGTGLNKMETLGVVCQCLDDADDDELHSVSSGPLLLENQKSATEVERISTQFVLGSAALAAVSALVMATDDTNENKAAALAVLGAADAVSLSKSALILSDFANGATLTSKLLSLQAPAAIVRNCGEHALENVLASAVAAEKGFLVEVLSELRQGTLTADDKQLAEINSFLYSLSKLLHVTTTDTYYLNIGELFFYWFKANRPSSHFMRMMRFRGSRFYAALENRYVLFHMTEPYDAFLSTAVGEKNKIELSVLAMLRKITAELASMTGAVWTDQLVRPTRFLLCSNKAASVTRTTEVAKALVAVFLEVIDDPSVIMRDTRRIVHFLPSAAGHDVGSDRTSERRSLYEHVALQSSSTSVYVPKLLKRQAEAMLAMTRKHFRDYLSANQGEDSGSDSDSDDGDGSDSEDGGDDGGGDGDGEGGELGGGDVPSVMHPLDESRRLSVGDSVLSMRRPDDGTQEGPYPAKIDAINSDGSLSLIFQDGSNDRDDAVPVSCLRLEVEVSEKLRNCCKKMCDLASSSNHAVESLFAIQDYMEKGAPGVDPSVLGAMAGAKFNKLSEWLASVRSKSPLLFRVICEYAFGAEIKHSRREAQEALTAAKEAQVARRVEQAKADDERRERKLKSDALFWARATTHRLEEPGQVDVVVGALTEKQFDWYYEYQIRIRKLGFNWEGSPDTPIARADRKRHLAELATSELDRHLPDAPVYSPPCVDPSSYASVASATAREQQLAHGEQQQLQSRSQQATIEACTEWVSHSILKKVRLALHPPPPTPPSSPDRARAKKKAKSKVGREKKRRPAKIGHLEGLSVGSAVEVC